MNSNMRSVLTAVALALTLSTGADAQDAAARTVLAEMQPESRLWLVGDSTLHAYTSQATEFDVELTVDSGAPLFNQIRDKKMRTLTVRVPVEKMKSGKAKLDKNLVKTLKGDVHPEIRFEMSTYDVRPSTWSGGYVVAATGNLTVAGQAKPIDLEAEVVSGDTIRVRGVKEVLMSNHGVKAPTFMGAIKTHDRVVINFDLLLK